MTSRVIVVGGGYGGVAVAKALDEIADVVLVEPRETFVHNVAALRAVAEPEWVDRLFIPYDGLLSRGTVRRDRAVRVGPSSVALAGGDVLTADFVVLATGTAYPAPAQPRDAAALRSARGELARARRVLLVGAGPVGLEFAGEIKAAWPATTVVLADRSPALMPGGYPDDFRTQLRAQLDALGVELRLGAPVDGLPAPGRYAPFGTADIWFPCYGAGPVSDYLAGPLAACRRPDGRIAVTPELRLPGTTGVFAVGDVTAVPEQKSARVAAMHAEVVAANIRAAIVGGPPVAHTPQPDMIILPLGPRGGVGYAPDAGVLGPAETAAIKADFYLGHYRELLGAVKVAG